MLTGMPAKPDTGSPLLCAARSLLKTFTWMGLRPLCSALRVGEQKPA